MYCKKLILINWGNIPNLEFDLGPINLLSGGNGSGKTTVADALQSLMTASYENLFNYNPGQDETTQRGRGGKQVRTLASYVLGCDDGSYARLKPTDGYIVGVFHPTKGETGSCFTAVLGSRAVIETAGKQRQARLRQLLFFIVPNQALDISQFLHEQKVTNLDEMGGLLRKRYGKDGVEIYDKKGAYLNRLYGAMRGMRSSVSKREAHHAAKTFSNFMAYKPVKSINDFVSKEILEPRDLSENIKQVSELMKTIHSMEAETRRITQVIDNLHELHGISADYVQNWLDWQLAEYRELVRQQWVKQQAYLSIQSKQSDNRTEQQDANLRLDELDEKRRIIHHKLVELEAKRQGIPALKNKDQLEKVIEENKGRLVSFAEPLLSQAQQLNTNHQLAKDLNNQIKESGIAAVTIPELGLKAFTRGMKAVIEHGTETDIDMSMLLTADFAGIANLENKLDKLRSFEEKHQALYAQLHLSTAAATLNAKPTILRDRVMAAHNLDVSHQARLKEQVNVKKREIQQLHNKTVSYPSHVEAALEAIIRQCPQARPAVLCDYINIIDDKWQMAIEGYIGGSRFSILVEPEFEAEAIRIVRNIPGRRNNAKVIQGEKARRDAAKSSAPHHSILEVMNFEHKIAEYYIKGAYGNVIRVEDEQALRATPRGITPEGLASGGYAMFRTDLAEDDLVFGQGARERALAAKQTQLDELNMKQHKAETTSQYSAQLLHAIDQFKPIQIGSLIQEMLSLYRAIENDEASLADLDLKDFESLENDLEQLTAESELNADHTQRYQTKLGRLESDAELISKQASDLTKQQETIEKQQEDSEKNIEGIADIYVAFDATILLREADEIALKHAKNADPDEGFALDVEQHQKACDALERQLDKGILQHNQDCRIEDSIIYQLDSGTAETSAHNKGWFKRIVGVKEETENITNRLKNNVLVGKHERLADLRDGFNNAFVTDLCHSIYQSITDGKRILDDLNKELETYHFGTDKEYYFFDYSWVPEFREYQRFFKEVISLPSLGDGNSLFDAELSDKSAKVRDQLLSMLLDNDEHIAMQELKRLSDYRNYRAYEIYKKPKDKEAIALSQYGTGSGGQLETPAYIIRSAAVTSAFKFNEGTTHCRLVLVDEAFSKMDETRSREVIDYLTEKLGLQLIFIMPSSKSGPFMDLISHQTIFSKCPSNSPIGELKSQVLVDRKICNQDKIKDLWANHRHVIRDQTTLDFMAEFAADDSKGDAA